MSLLTKTERKTLTKEARKALRVRRRADQKAELAKSGVKEGPLYAMKIQNAARHVVVALNGKFNIDAVKVEIKDAIAEILEVSPGASDEELVAEASDIIGDKIDTLFDFTNAKIKVGPLSIPIGVALERIDGQLFDAIAYLVASSLVRAYLLEKKG